MLRWMLSPKDSCETPICSERKRDSVPIFAAIDLVDGRPAGAVAGERRAGHHAAHRFVVAVAGARYGGRRVIEAGEDVNIVAERRQRRRHGVSRNRRRSRSGIQ